MGLVGELGYHKVSPRKLLSSFLNKLVCVVGIVTKCSLVHPKMVKSVHYCETTKKFTSRHYVDETDLSGAAVTTTAMPIKDEHGNPLTTEIGLCQFVDNQRVTLQELPETAPPGQLPRSTGVHLCVHLNDACVIRSQCLMRSGFLQECTNQQGVATFAHTSALRGMWRAQHATCRAALRYMLHLASATHHHRNTARLSAPCNAAQTLCSKATSSTRASPATAFF